jgi:hypothetical protein
MAEGGPLVGPEGPVPLMAEGGSLVEPPEGPALWAHLRCCQLEDPPSEKKDAPMAQSALGSRRIVNSMRSPGCSRQDSIWVM